MNGLVRKETGGLPRLFDSVFNVYPFDVFERAFGLEPAFRPLSPFAGGGGLAKFEFRPSFAVKETPNSYVVTADLPGVKEEDVKVTLAESVLRIEGHRKEERKEDKENYYLSERAYGSFTRGFELPHDADASKVSAEMKDGVLTVVVEKKAEMTPKTVQISVGKKK